MKYFERSGIPITIERCNSLISRSGESLGDYDFFFEWLKKPSFEEMNRLIEEMDEALTPYHCLYTIYNK
jgi:ASC-1-like (ASCH) protein